MPTAFSWCCQWQLATNEVSQSDAGEFGFQEKMRTKEIVSFLCVVRFYACQREIQKRDTLIRTRQWGRRGSALISSLFPQCRSRGGNGSRMLSRLLPWSKPPPPSSTKTHTPALWGWKSHFNSSHSMRAQVGVGERSRAKFECSLLKHISSRGIKNKWWMRIANKASHPPRQ